MLIDTGARDLTISSSVVQDLGLQPSGRVQEAHGLGGRLEMLEYEASLLLPLTDECGNVDWKGFPVYAWQMSELHMLQMGGAGRVRIIGIMGRILLQYATFIYDGMNGSFELRLDLGAYVVRGRAGGQTGG